MIASWIVSCDGREKSTPRSTSETSAMASLEISIEPSTDCSAAMSCGGVRSPGLEGRSPGAYDAGPSPQSSSGGSGMLRASWSVTLNVPPDRAVCDPGRDADEARGRHRHPEAGPGHPSGTGTARPPDATSADHPGGNDVSTPLARAGG